MCSSSKKDEEKKGRRKKKCEPIHLQIALLHVFQRLLWHCQLRIFQWWDSLENKKKTKFRLFELMLSRFIYGMYGSLSSEKASFACSNNKLYLLNCSTNCFPEVCVYMWFNFVKTIKIFFSYKHLRRFPYWNGT